MKTTLEMAREAGADTLMYWDIEKLKRFEALVRADERAAPVHDENQAFIDSLPTDSDDKMYMQIHHWARITAQHSNGSWVSVGDELKAFEALVRADERAASVQEPVARQYQGRDGVWNDFISEKHYKDTLADGSWPIRNLYTDPPAPTPVPLTDEQVDSATKAWFENDIVAGRNPFRKRMRAAFAAAHAITEKGD
jgi:hypothetical protein